MNSNASVATIFVPFEKAGINSNINVYNVLNEGLFDSPCGAELYFPREMKVEPDLSLVRDESSVRYFLHIIVIAKSIYNYPCEYV